MDNSLRKATNGISDFLELESAGGLLLMVAAVLALICSNSPFRHAYDDLLKIPVELRFGSFVSTLSGITGYLLLRVGSEHSRTNS
jgi:NhaA family Na+:H+ antiporter